MARPRIFISSTYYDLKNVRVALSGFVQQMGFDPVLNEQGAISYGKQKSIDVYCYDEIENCDILVCLIGGRFGSVSSDGNNSVTQKELKTALDLGKQVYIFVESGTLTEYRTYKNNKGANIKWVFADNVKVYEFIDDLFSLPSNNAIFPFETSDDIVNILREQWAGLFQRLLTESSFSNLVTAAQEINQGLNTIRQVVTKISIPAEGSKVSDLTLIEHPLFSRLKSVLNVKYRVFFISLDEMHDWLKSRSLEDVSVENWDDPGTEEWFERKYKDVNDIHPLLKISRAPFDSDGNLLPSSDFEWTDDMVKFVSYNPATDKTLEE